MLNFFKLLAFRCEARIENSELKNLKNINAAILNNNIAFVLYILNIPC